ncbi:hypothetical protein LguiA_015222 [Lonicera macranthoides]
MFGFNIRTRQNNVSSPAGRAPKAAAASPNSLGESESSRVVPFRSVGLGSPKNLATPKGQPGSPKELVVGEIDTSAPFRSVKAALSLFAAEGATPSPKGAKPPPLVKKSKTPEERVLEKETHLHLTLKELGKFKEKLKHAESTRQQGRYELDKANRTLQELTLKLEAVTEAKYTAIEATEAAKSRARELEDSKTNQPEVNAEAWKQDVDSEREQYRATSGELNYAKQELANLRQDFDAALEAKLAAFNESADAQHAAKVNRERLSDLLREIGMMQQTLAQVKHASAQAQETHSKVMAEKEAYLQSRRTTKDEVESRIRDLKDEYKNSDLSGNLEEKFEEATEAIGVIQEQLKDLRASDLDSLSSAKSELEDTKRALEEVLVEERSTRRIVESLQLELENVKSETNESKDKESEKESLIPSLKLQLQETKAALEVALAEGKKAGIDSESMHSQLREISSEAEHAREEAEEINRKAKAFRQEAETTRTVAKETEEKLQIALKEVEEAKEAEKLANDQMHNSGTRAEDDKATDSGGSDSKIRLSAEEFENLTRKVEEVGNSADMKVATAMAQVEAIKSREKETLEKLEVSLKERAELEAATKDAHKKAEMAEAAKQAVENELCRWRQKGDDNVEGEASYMQEGSLI